MTYRLEIKLLDGNAFMWVGLNLTEVQDIISSYARASLNIFMTTE
jgi:hypothetical protein